MVGLMVMKVVGSGRWFTTAPRPLDPERWPSSGLGRLKDREHALEEVDGRDEAVHELPACVVVDLFDDRRHHGQPGVRLRIK
jgi:hypothetical protein